MTEYQEVTELDSAGRGVHMSTQPLRGHQDLSHDVLRVARYNRGHGVRVQAAVRRSPPLFISIDEYVCRLLTNDTEVSALSLFTFLRSRFSGVSMSFKAIIKTPLINHYFTCEPCIQ